VSAHQWEPYTLLRELSKERVKTMKDVLQESDPNPQFPVIDERLNSLDLVKRFDAQQ
jgi:hypothetical protein